MATFKKINSSLNRSIADAIIELYHLFFFTYYVAVADLGGGAQPAPFEKNSINAPPPLFVHVPPLLKPKKKKKSDSARLYPGCYLPPPPPPT